MEEYEIHVEGAKVVFSTEPPRPHNPLNRPKIRYKRPLLALFFYALGCFFLALGLSRFFPDFLVLGLLLWTALYLALIAKSAVIWLVHLYQNKASDRTRLKCMFEPSCSEYMILAVEKYGVVRGVFKGIRRLLRCHPPNGGKDYP